MAIERIVVLIELHDLCSAPPFHCCPADQNLIKLIVKLGLAQSCPIASLHHGADPSLDKSRAQ